MEQNDFIKGALLGGILGGIATLLIAPKSGQDLRDDIMSGYNSISRHAQDFKKDVKERGQSIMDSLNGVEHTHSPNTFFTGSAFGAVIAVLAALLLAPQSGSKLRERLGDQYDAIREKAEEAMNDFNHTRHNIEDKIDDWKGTFLTIIDKLSSHKRGKHNSTGIDEIVEWASLGLRLYNQLQKRR